MTTQLETQISQFNDHARNISENLIPDHQGYIVQQTSERTDTTFSKQELINKMAPMRASELLGDLTVEIEKYKSSYPELDSTISLYQSARDLANSIVEVKDPSLIVRLDDIVGQWLEVNSLLTKDPEATVRDYITRGVGLVALHTALSLLQPNSPFANLPNIRSYMEVISDAHLDVLKLEELYVDLPLLSQPINDNVLSTDNGENVKKINQWFESKHLVNLFLAKKDYFAQLIKGHGYATLWEKEGLTVPDLARDHFTLLTFITLLRTLAWYIDSIDSDDEYTFDDWENDKAGLIRLASCLDEESSAQAMAELTSVENVLFQ